MGRRRGTVLARMLSVAMTLAITLMAGEAWARPARASSLPLRQIIPIPIQPGAPGMPPAGNGGSTLAPSFVGQPNTWRIADTGGIPARVRAAPSIDATIVMRLDPGTVVEALTETATADGYQWRRISVGGAAGWIVTSLLLEPAVPPPVSVVNVIGAVGERGLNFRAGPSTSAAIIGSLSEGTVVELVGTPTDAEGRRWQQVRADGATGWVIADAITQR